MSGMDDVVSLTADEAKDLARALAAWDGPAQVAVDDIDRALKVKGAGRWSPPIGRMDHRGDAGRRHLDDLAEEARSLARTSTVHPLTCTRPCCLDPADLR